MGRRTPWVVGNKSAIQLKLENESSGRHRFRLDGPFSKFYLDEASRSAIQISNTEKRAVSSQILRNSRM